MKRLAALILLAITTTVIASSCSSKGGHCDAYGSVHTAPANDLAAK